MTTLKQKDIDTILKDRDGLSCDLIEVLQDVQEVYGFLPEDVLRLVAERLEVTVIEVFRVANFYKA